MTKKKIKRFNGKHLKKKITTQRKGRLPWLSGCHHKTPPTHAPVTLFFANDPSTKRDGIAMHFSRGRKKKRAFNPNYGSEENVFSMVTSALLSLSLAWLFGVTDFCFGFFSFSSLNVICYELLSSSFLCAPETNGFDTFCFENLIQNSYDTPGTSNLII